MPDLSAYLKLIKLDLPTTHEPNLQLLKQIVSAHLRAFPYVNTELFIQGKKSRQDRVICPIDIDAIFEQMVIQNRPGYCFQNAELLAWVLTELGFSVTRHLAKIIKALTEKINEKAVEESEFTHELLIVELPQSGVSKYWIVDTAFGNNSLREPVAIQPGDQEIAAEYYRFNFLAGQNLMRLEIKLHHGWLTLYQLDRESKSLLEINQANQQLFTSENEAPILKILNVAIVNPHKRKSIAYIPDGPTFFKSVSSPQKKYELVSFAPGQMLNRHTIAVEFTDENRLRYAVLDPLCPKDRKTMLMRDVSLVELQQEIGEMEGFALFEKLRADKAADDPLAALKPFLPQLLAITARRGDTHRREIPIQSFDQLRGLAKVKFGIDLDAPELPALTGMARS